MYFRTYPVIVEYLDGATGSVSVQGMNGVGDYEYHLNNLSNSTGQFTSLDSGEYDLIVTDGNGCSRATTVIIPESNDITIESSNSTKLSQIANRAEHSGGGGPAGAGAE